jgi:hypothetical protein
MPHLGVVNNPNGKKPIWRKPDELLADFEAFLSAQHPHFLPENDQLSKQGVISVRQFASWKGVHRTTITTGYSQGTFKAAYLTILGTCESYAEERLYEAKRPAANIIFVLKNCYGWTDRRKAKLADTVSQPLSPQAQAYLDEAMAIG